MWGIIYKILPSICSNPVRFSGRTIDRSLLDRKSIKEGAGGKTYNWPQCYQ